MRSPEMSKCCSERWVCAPHRRSAGTSIGPKVSRSVRVAGGRKLGMAEFLGGAKAGTAAPHQHSAREAMPFAEAAPERTATALRKAAAR